MTRVALDSNILVYAELEPETAKGRRAADVIVRASRDGVIPVQVFGEYLRVIQRRMPEKLEEAVRQVSVYRAIYLTPASTEEVLAEAARLTLSHKLQLWDAVVCAAARSAGAEVLLTEDLQDGAVLAGLRFVSPFVRANTDAIDGLIGAKG